jgi:DNA-binding transcriptional regulator YdaS (Cro superfamily)
VLGSDWNASSIYGSVGERVHDLAMRGIRLVIDDFRADVTKTLKSGKRGRLRIAYGDPRKPDTAEPAVKWLWRYVDGARTAGELYGRALVVIAAEQYACRLVVPSSQQGLPIRYSSHADRAQKALAKLVGPHLPASLKQLQKAIDRVDAEHQAACAAARKTSVQTTNARPDDAEPDPDDAIGDGEDAGDELDPDEDLEVA